MIGEIGGGEQVTDIVIQRAGSVDFGQATYTVSEGAGKVSITLRREGGSAGPRLAGTPVPVTVDVKTSPGTASANDYTEVATTVSFADGEVSKLIEIPIAQDGAFESPENFNVTLSNLTGGIVLTNTGSTQVTILDSTTPTIAPTETPVPPTPTPVADITRPTVLTTLSADYRRGTVLGRGIVFSASCSEACIITAQLVAPPGIAKKLGLGKVESVVGTGTATLASAGKTTMTIVVADNAVKRRFKTIDSSRLLVRVSTTDLSDNVLTEETTVKISK